MNNLIVISDENFEESEMLHDVLEEYDDFKKVIFSKFDNYDQHNNSNELVKFYNIKNFRFAKMSKFVRLFFGGNLFLQKTVGKVYGINKTMVFQDYYVHFKIAQNKIIKDVVDANPENCSILIANGIFTLPFIVEISKYIKKTYNQEVCIVGIVKRKHFFRLTKKNKSLKNNIIDWINKYYLNKVNKIILDTSK